jgi:hypothetical protein
MGNVSLVYKITSGAGLVIKLYGGGELAALSSVLNWGIYGVLRLC